MEKSEFEEQVSLIRKGLENSNSFRQMPLAKRDKVVRGVWRMIHGEPWWSVGPLMLSALAGLLALVAAVLHVIKQVKQLHRNQAAEGDEAPSLATKRPLTCPSPYHKPALHIDHYTPLMLALM